MPKIFLSKIPFPYFLANAAQRVLPVPEKKKTSVLHSLASPPEIWADNGQIFYRLLSQQSFKIFLSNIHSWSLVAFSLERIKTCCKLEEMRSVHPIPSFPLVWFLDLFYLFIFFYFFFLLVKL